MKDSIPFVIMVSNCVLIAGCLFVLLAVLGKAG